MHCEKYTTVKIYNIERLNLNDRFYNGKDNKDSLLFFLLCAILKNICNFAKQYNQHRPSTNLLISAETPINLVCQMCIAVFL